MNDLCYEYSQVSICLNCFDCLFVHKDVRCTNKTQIKDRLQHANKKLSLPRNAIILYTPEDLVTN